MSVIAVVGLGYVGLPLAVAFGRHRRTFGLDLNVDKIEAYRAGHDPSGEITSDELKSASHLSFHADPLVLREADVVIVAVPTPVDDARQPDFGPLERSSATVGSHLKKGAMVVYESTVYPGATESICVPILESQSGLRWKQDFSVAYSPERINPGDRERTLTRIVKIVAGDTEATLDRVAALYESIVEAGVHRVGSIAVAEAAKVIENTQRDLNIALMNELSMIFRRLDIDTLDVLEAAGTKWNFLPFRPGLVGGHCIGVDPYYLTHCAEKAGYHPQVILAGRRINDGMGGFIAEQTVKQMIARNLPVKGADVIVMGLTFKEDCTDLRNSKVIDVIQELRSFGVQVHVHDPVAHAAEALEECQVDLIEWSALPPAQAIVCAVAHRDFRILDPSALAEKLATGGLLIDVKGIYDRDRLSELGIPVWRP